MDKKSPLISVVTVTYNAAATVERTIRSVLGQTYARVEYVVIDGASGDGTKDIVSGYADRLKWVSEPDGGLYDAMNKGLAMVTGDYVCFLNAGDKFHTSDTLAMVAAAVQQLPELPDIVYGETDLVDDEGRFLRHRRLSAPEQLDWRSFRNGMLVCHQAFWVRRDKAVAYDLRYRYSSDFDWCIRVLKESHAPYNTHLVLIDYLSEGMTTQNRWASLKERFAIMRRHYGLLDTLCRHAWFALRLVLKR